MVRSAASLAAIALAALAASPARAETFHHCVGFIDTLPAVLSTRGTWCLRKDLATALSDGTVVEIATSNVTIDCNGYKIGNLAAPPPRSAIGIGASGRSNLAIRNCSLRGFGTGIYLTGVSHLIEDVTVEAARIAGIWADGDGSTLRRNRIVDTGIDDDIGLGWTYGILLQGDGSRVHDNVVYGVYGSVDEQALATGIAFFGVGHWVHDNQIAQIIDGGGGIAGIRSSASSQAVIERNVISNLPGPGVGIDVYGNTTRPVCSDNHVRGFSSPMPNCLDGGGNYLD